MSSGTLALALVGTLLAQPDLPQERARLERVRRLPRQERGRLLERLAEFKNLPHEERDRLQENLRWLKRLSPDRVARLRGWAQGLPLRERWEYAGLARDFFRWARRKLPVEGFPRSLFFSWLRREHPDQWAKIRAMEGGPGGPRTDAFAKLYVAFRTKVLDRAQAHVRRHGCVDPAAVAALGDLPPQLLWPKLQEFIRSCPKGRARP